MEKKKKSYNEDQGLKICVHIQVMCSERYVQCKFVFHGFLTEENRHPIKDYSVITCV